MVPRERNYDMPDLHEGTYLGTRDDDGDSRGHGGISPMMFALGVVAIVVAILFANGKMNWLTPMSVQDRSDIALAEAMAANEESKISFGGIQSIGAQERADRHRAEAEKIRNR